MKRFLGLVLIAVGCSQIHSFAADPLADVAMVAAQRENEERYKRLSADVQTLLDNQEVITKQLTEIRQRLSKYEDDLRSVKEDQGRSSNNFASRDDLRKYVEKLRELDEKREADKKLFLDSFKELKNMPAPVPAPTVTEKPASRRTPENPEASPFVYTVKKNDRLLDIIAEYNDYFQKNGMGKISRDDVIKANPGLKPDLLRAGQKIRIPAHPKENSKTKAGATQE